MIYTAETKKALKLCFDAHKNQLDKSGMPYVFHPFHMAEQMADEDTTIVALLHDVVEDSHYTLRDLESMGFGAKIIDALRLLTHDDSIPYLEYVTGIRRNPIARTVKLADLRHNSDATRLESVTAKDKKRMLKYRMAEAILEDKDEPVDGCFRKRIPLDHERRQYLSVFYKEQQVLRYSLDVETDSARYYPFDAVTTQRIRALLPSAASLPEALAEYLAIGHSGEDFALLLYQQDTRDHQQERAWDAPSGEQWGRMTPRKAQLAKNMMVYSDTMRYLEKGSRTQGDKVFTLQLTPERQRQAKVFDERQIADIREHAKGKGLVCFCNRCGYSVLQDNVIEATRKYGNLIHPWGSQKPALVLNFASPTHPGGKYPGEISQEGLLCRSSSLFVSLTSEAAQPFYQAHRQLKHTLASDAMILSPEVEIVRGEDTNLLENTVIISVLSCAAPDVNPWNAQIPEDALKQLLYNRIMGMLHVAAHEGYDRLILGAWGCDIFGNDPDMVSDMFYQALKDFRRGGDRERDTFKIIVFAVPDSSQEQHIYKAFERNFSHFYRDEDLEIEQAVLRRIKEREVNLDAIRGSLIGGAIGDALGYPVEFIGWNQIRSRYGNSGISEYELDSERKVAIISDDTQMTLFTICGLLCQQTRFSLRGVAADTDSYVHNAYMDWLSTQIPDKVRLPEHPLSWILTNKALHARRAPGNACLSALLSGKARSIKDPINDSKGCGGVMRIAPIGLIVPDLPKEHLDELDMDGAKIAAITHGHPLGYIPAAFLTHVIHEAAFHSREFGSLADVCTEAMTATERLFGQNQHFPYFKALMKRAFTYAHNHQEDIENIHALGGGWVAEEAVAIAVYCSIRYDNNFTQGIIASVNHSGDSDSTGAITGNILGAWLGYDRIEDKWKQNLELSDLILELAGDLCHGCQMDEYSSYVDEVWLQKYRRGRPQEPNTMLRGL